MSLDNIAAEDTAYAADEKLVRECLDGHEEAWAALVDKYRNLIFSIPIRHGLARDDASEIFQEVCLTMLSKLSSLREPRSLAAWLIQVTSRKCSQWKRNEARSAAELLAFDFAEGDAIDPSSLMFEELHREQVLREAVSELPDRCKHLIRMLFFTAPAVPYQQAAKTLGLALGSVGFIRMCCLAKLRRRLETRGFQ